MRRSRRLALALAVCALGAPAAAQAQAGTTPATSQTPSPFKADRLGSTPSGLTPNSVATPFRYPVEPVALTWGEVPGAKSYTVEVSDTPGFGTTVWSASTTQPVAVPEALLPDGQYWWRVKAVDAAGTVGATSDVARFQKSWASGISGLKMAALPGGAAASHVFLNPYFSWAPVPGATTYDLDVARGDQFASPSFVARNISVPFASPAATGTLPDGTYSWRVRARDPKGNTGPWTVGATFTKGWVAPSAVTPADGAVTHDVRLGWEPVDGAELYEVQISDLEHNWTGQALKASAVTAANGFTPTLAEEQTNNMVNGDLWWRVRPRSAGAYGAWSAPRKITWQAAPPGARTPAAVLSSSGDTDTGLSPTLTWTPVTGATLYRIDIASDPQFTNLAEQQITSSTSWTSRVPLDDNQVGAGYHWRVVWGSGVSSEEPHWDVDEGSVATATFRKQTRVVPSAAGDGGVVAESPLLSWASVPGIAKYQVELSQDGRFGEGGTRRGTVFGLGGVSGSFADAERRLPDGTWSWRVRAIDGATHGQTWSPVRTFTLNSPRPSQIAPADGASVVFSPVIRWSPVTGACAYDVEVSLDPSFPARADEGMQTAQTALVPPSTAVTTPGRHYWRVRADYCDDIKGQWSPTRSFRSVFPPSFNLNSIPKRVEYRKQVVVGGQLKNNGGAVKKARLYLERRIFPKDTYRPAGMVRTDNRGRFRFGLRMNRSADYRLVWRESASNPQGVAAFGIDVAPRVTFRLASSKVTRKKGLRVKGSIYPRRPAAVQVRTSDGWKTVRKLKPTRQRFSVVVPTGRIEPGKHRLRLYVPRDAQRRFATVSSRQRGVLVYDRFVVR